MGVDLASGYPGTLQTPNDFRKLAAWSKQKGVDGFKVLALDPPLIRALLDASKQQGLGVAAHLSQLMVARFNAVTAAEAGLTTLEHWYGLPESLFDDRTIQDYPADYNYQDECHRFGQAGRLWKQAAQPGSKKWDEAMQRFLKQDFVFSPTLTIYEASRDLMRKNGWIRLCRGDGTHSGSPLPPPCRTDDTGHFYLDLSQVSDAPVYVVAGASDKLRENCWYRSANVRPGALNQQAQEIYVARAVLSDESGFSQADLAGLLEQTKKAGRRPRTD